MKNSLLNRFVPKESKFFPLLNQLSQTVLNASELLIDSMNMTHQRHGRSIITK